MFLIRKITPLSRKKQIKTIVIVNFFWKKLENSKSKRKKSSVSPISPKSPIKKSVKRQKPFLFPTISIKSSQKAILQSYIKFKNDVLPIFE